MLSGGNFNVKKLVPTHRYRGIDPKSSIKCSKKIEADINLHIRYGNSLVLQHVVWRVCDQDRCTVAIIGLPLIEIIRCNGEVIL